MTFANFKTAWNFYAMAMRHLPNPDVVLRKRGMGIGAYRDLLADAHLAACLRSRKAPVMALEWVLDRGDAPARVHKALRGWAESVDVSGFLDELMDVVYWGYMPVELGWEMAGGLWLPARIETRPPEWFVFGIDEAGETDLRFLSKSAPIDGEIPPDEWTLLHAAVGASYDNPYGRGVASQCFWPCVFKKAGIEFWLNWCERFVSPWVKGRVPAGTSEADMAAFRSDLEDLVQDAVVVVSGDDDVDMLSQGDTGGSSAAFGDLCGYMDTQISKAVLSQTLTTEVQDKGALSTAKVHGTVRDDIVDADTKTAAGLLNRIVRMTLKRNGFNPSAAPPHWHPFEEDDIRTDLAERDERLNKTMQASGVSLSPEYFRRTYNLDAGDISAAAPVQPAAAPRFAGQKLPWSSIETNQNALDALISAGAEGATGPLTALAEGVIEAVRGARDYDEVMSRAASAFDSDTAVRIAESLAEAMFAAGVWGRVERE